MKNFRFSNWERGVMLFPKAFFYDISVDDTALDGGKRLNIVCFYLKDRPEVGTGERWTFWKHYIGINTYICFDIRFRIYR